MDENIQRAINSGLSIVERGLRNIIKDLKEDNESEWILRKSLNDIDEETARQLTEKAELMLDDIREFDNAYKLEKNLESTRWRLTTSLSEIWSILNELTPEHLRGYGTMTPEEDNELKARIDRTLAVCNEMRNILSNQG